MTNSKLNTGSLRKLAASSVVVVAALVILLVMLGIVLNLQGRDPIGVVQAFIRAVSGTERARADVVMNAMPLLLCASGLLLTFTTGLWNIGIEGQITMGAVFATIVARTVTADTPPWLVLPIELLLGMLGGALWALVAGILKTKGNVNEIFGGVALNFVAQNILLALLNGPWREGTYLRTEKFAAPALLPALEGSRLSAVAIALAVISYGLVFFALKGTKWGLELKAMGKSIKSAALLGVRTERNLLLSMIACGALAGLAGSFLVLFTYEQLIPGVSGGVGFTAVLIALLVNAQPLFVPLVALGFALVPVGSLKLAAALNDKVRVETSLGNVFISGLVLAVLLVDGIRTRFSKKTT